MAFVNEAIIRKKYNGGNSESSLFSVGLGISEMGFSGNFCKKFDKYEEKLCSTWV